MGLHFLFMLIIFRSCYFIVSTLSTASTSGSVRLRMENFWILVFVILKSENGNFPFPFFFSRIRTFINGEFFYGIHEKSHKENKISVIVNVQISENGTFPFSCFFRIPTTRIQKFSILNLTDPTSNMVSYHTGTVLSVTLVNALHPT